MLSYRSLIDVETTSCVYWAFSLHALETSEIQRFSGGVERRPATLLNKRLWHGVFLWILRNVKNTIFSRNTSSGCFCFNKIGKLRCLESFHVVTKLLLNSDFSSRKLFNNSIKCCKKNSASNMLDFPVLYQISKLTIFSFVMFWAKRRPLFW